MDDIISALAVSQVTVQSNSTAAEHPRFALYKTKRSSASQEERRKKHLDAQKSQRYDYASHARKLATCEWSEDEEGEEMEFEEYSVKKPRSYQNQLMLSEWLVEVPHDLAEEWYLMLCPIGKRCLVVASRGCTRVYAKSGYQIKYFPSLLPGGRKSPAAPLNAYSLLDCVYNELEKTYYILDVMCWNSHPCFDSETEFRFYWMQSKVEECSEVKTISKDNPYKFIPLPHFSCDRESIKNTLASPLPFPSKLDGLLFYHKKSHYTCGSTPLVGWLKGYMVPEMLGIDIPESLAKEKPVSYTSMQKHCPEAFERHAKRKEEEEKNMVYEEQ